MALVIGGVLVLEGAGVGVDPVGTWAGTEDIDGLAYG
jgi:hypothetical protein